MAAAPATPANGAANQLPKPAPLDLPKMSVACVIDGSVSFVEHWEKMITYFPSIIQLFTTQVLSSLGPNSGRSPSEILPNCQLAVVVYGSEANHTNGSPISARLHFTAPQAALKLMKEETDLGIGHSYSIDNRGMATLEALVTALEVSSSSHSRY